jgi:hypothetical protein
MPACHGFRPHEYQGGFPVLPNHVQTDPKESITVVQFWPPNAAFEHGQLVAQRGILQRNLFLTGKNKKNESNRNHNCVQHRETSLQSSTRRINRLEANEVLANHTMVGSD